MTYLQLMDSDDFRLRIAMYVGANDFSSVAYFFRGYVRALEDLKLPTARHFDSFKAWLVMRLPQSSRNTDWAGVVMQHFGTGPEATDQFFILWKAFREEITVRGLDAMWADYKNFLGDELSKDRE